MGAGRRSTLLTPEQVLELFDGGPVTGVFTDGSCEGNPGPGGWGYVWVDRNRVIESRWGAARDTTNNRMELTALIEAYRALPEDLSTTVYSDSQLCVNTINKWASAWEKRGWRRKTGEVRNVDLVRNLHELAQAHPHVRLKWIKAHDGSRWNEYVDALAATYLRER